MMRVTPRGVTFSLMTERRGTASCFHRVGYFGDTMLRERRRNCPDIGVWHFRGHKSPANTQFLPLSRTSSSSTTLHAACLRTAFNLAYHRTCFALHRISALSRTLFFTFGTGFNGFADPRVYQNDLRRPPSVISCKRSSCPNSQHSAHGLICVFTSFVNRRKLVDARPSSTTVQIGKLSVDRYCSSADEMINFCEYQRWSSDRMQYFVASSHVACLDAI